MNIFEMNLSNYADDNEDTGAVESISLEALQSSVEDMDLLEGTACEAERDLDKVEIHLQLWDRAVQNVESSYVYAEQSLEAGGLKGASAELFHNLYNSGAEFLGPAYSEEVPSLESFNVEGAAELETRMAMDKAKKTVKAAVDAVMKVINSLINTVTRLYDQYLSKTARLNRAADKMMDMIKAAKTSGSKAKPENSKVKFGGLEFVALPGETHIGDFAKGLAGNSKLSKALADYANALKGVKADKASVDDAVQKIEEVEKDIEDAVKEALMLKDKAKGDALKASGFQESSYAEILMSPVLTGGRAFVVGFPKSDSDLSVSVKMVVAEKSKAEDVDAVDLTGALGVVKSGQDLIKMHDQVLKTMRGMQSQAKGMSDAIKGASKVLDSVEDKGVTKDILNKIKNMKQLVNLTYAPHKDVATIAASTVQAHLAYAKASIKNLKGVKADKDKEYEGNDAKKAREEKEKKEKGGEE